MYIQVVSNFSGTWRAGHGKYWEILEQKSAEFRLQPDNIHVFESIFQFLRALFQSAFKCTQVPNLARCLTIYQIEYEIQQIIWHGYEAESWRIHRLVNWLDGGVDDLLREIAELEQNAA